MEYEVLTILPIVMSPTRAVGAMRLRDICSDSCTTGMDRERDG